MPNFQRQSELLGPQRLNRYPITVIGAGGIGSWTVVQLAKCGFPSLTVWDPDLVEAHNCPNQAYWPSHVGRPKVECLAEIVAAESACTIQAVQQAFTPKDSRELRGIVIAAVDTMAARTTIWKATCKNAATALFIDGRMGGEQGRVYAINPFRQPDIDCYVRSLYPDSIAADPCTIQSVLYNLWVVTGLIGRSIKAFLADDELPTECLFDLKTLSWVFRNARGDVIATTTRRRKEAS